MKRKSTIVSTTALSLALAATLSARTWTDAATGRTIQGKMVGSNSTHVEVQVDNRRLSIEIARLSEADKAFIKKQSEMSNSPEDGAQDSKVPDSTEEISALLKKGLSEEQGKEEREKVAAFFKSLLPQKGADGEPVEWEVTPYQSGGSYPKDSLMMAAYLYPAGDDENRLMWAHILYTTEESAFEPMDKFLGYGVIRAEDAHAFLTVNRVDFRLVADDESYRDDKKIEAILKASDLETMEKL